MPTRSRQSGARAAAQAEVEEAGYNIDGLDYHDALSWRAGKPIAVADLFTRLQKLSAQLRNVEQGTIVVEEIESLARDLVNPNLLGHKDKGVRAWTVSCVVDVLNICAPNAPYRPNQLKDIFTVITNTIIPALTDPSNAYNAQHQYVLNQLVDAQSIVLINDIQDPDALISQLFTICFDVVSGSGKNASGMELGQSIIFQLTMMLNAIVDEANLPQEVIDIIISQFLRVDPRTSEQPVSKKKKTAGVKDKTQSTLILKDYPPAYNLAKSVCTACSEKLSTAISLYFSTIITNASTALASADEGKGRLVRRRSHDEDSDDDGEDSLNDLRKAHRLVRELWRACPDVLVNVIPQIELELAADSIRLRELAVLTIGDLVAGIGVAGLPELPVLDPAAFPLPTIDNANITVFSTNPLLKPSAPKPFIHIHATTYQAFLGRRIDRAVDVRVAWVHAASRMLLTRAGDIGFTKEELTTLIPAYANMLKDIDERVRLTALEKLGSFPYHSLIELLGSDGGLSEPSSLLSIVADRVMDKKHLIRDEAMSLLGNMWGVASRDIGDGNARIRSILGQAPTRLFTAMYAKDPHTNVKLPEVLYERLLPLSYPPTKGKVVISETQGDGDVSETTTDSDTLRVKRLLTMISGLDEKAKPVFFELQKRQVDVAKAMALFLKKCEDYNGGINDNSADEQESENHLTRYIDNFARLFPDTTKASHELWKFVRAHDRRSYQLIKYAMGTENDIKTVFRSIRELRKRILDPGNNMGSSIETLMPMIYQSSLISYNRSHIAAILEFARSGNTELADAAQMVLKQISEKVPEVMKTHIQVLCGELENAAPSEDVADLGSTTDSLKACSAFAKKFPDDIPSKDRKFMTALQNYVLFSTSPAAAKHATTIILLTSDRKELRAKEILTKAIKRVKSNPKNKVAQLAAIAQVCLLAPSAGNTEDDALMSIIQSTLRNTEQTQAKYEQNSWSDDVDAETAAKQMALKIYVNCCRADFGKEGRDKLTALITSTLQTLMKLIENDGEYVEDSLAPSVQRNQLRLTAAQYILKLCRHVKQCEELVTPQMFQIVAWILVSPPYGVRGGLVRQLKKYLSMGRLSTRWLTLLFLLPFEPDDQLRLSTMAWLRTRPAYYLTQHQSRANIKGEKSLQNPNIMELTFARFLSLLAHHPDFPSPTEDDYDGQILDFANYIIFYLQCVATDENISLIFHVAQRVKQASDAVSKNVEMDQRLYVLSDLAQATIRNYADSMHGSQKGTSSIEAWPGKAHLPSSLFQAISGSARAGEIAAKNFLPEEVALGLESLVRKMIRLGKQNTSTRNKQPTSNKKRRSSISVDLDEGEADDVRRSVKKSKSAKKSSNAKLAIRETPNAKKRKSEHVTTTEQPSRKSARTSTARKITYEESDEDEDNDDAENIVKYKPVAMGKHTHSSRKAQEATPDIEEEEMSEHQPEEDEIGSEEELGHESASPTPAVKGAAALVDNNKADDVEMTDDEHEEDADEGAAEQANVTDQNEEGGEEEAPTPPPSKRNGRARRTKLSPVPRQASTNPPQLKARSKEKQVGGKMSESNTPIKSTKTKIKAPVIQAVSPPPAESGRRSSRRSKV